MECAAEAEGIRLNTVHPGVIDAPIWTKLSGSGRRNVPIDPNEPGRRQCVARLSPLNFRKSQSRRSPAADWKACTTLKHDWTLLFQPIVALHSSRAVLRRASDCRRLRPLASWPLQPDRHPEFSRVAKPRESGSHVTRCWREVDSNPRSPCGGWRLGLLRRSYGKFRRANCGSHLTHRWRGQSRANPSRYSLLAGNIQGIFSTPGPISSIYAENGEEY